MWYKIVHVVLPYLQLDGWRIRSRMQSSNAEVPVYEKVWLQMLQHSFAR